MSCRMVFLVVIGQKPEWPPWLPLFENFASLGTVALRTTRNEVANIISAPSANRENVIYGEGNEWIGMEAAIETAPVGHRPDAQLQLSAERLPDCRSLCVWGFRGKLIDVGLK